MHIDQSADHQLDDSIARQKHLIRANYWFRDGEGVPDDVYHEVLYDKGRDAMCRCCANYWMPSFSPLRYGYRFDTMANGLATLLDVADDAQCEAVDGYIADHIVHDEVMLLPAFDPVITPKNEDWHDLQMTFSHTFKNAPHEYHNGGLWPLVTGFYAASLAKRGNWKRTRHYCGGIHTANRLEIDGREWSFPEYRHGKQHTPGDTSPMGWSAAVAIVRKSLFGSEIIGDHTTIIIPLPAWRPFGCVGSGTSGIGGLGGGSPGRGGTSGGSPGSGVPGRG